MHVILVELAFNSENIHTYYISIFSYICCGFVIRYANLEGVSC